MKKLTLALLMLSCPVFGQISVREVAYYPLLSDYNLNATAYTYCRTIGDLTGASASGGATLGSDIPSIIRAKNSGSSTTVSAFTATTNPFRPVSVGDEINFSVAGTLNRRYVVTKPDNDTVTVNTAIDLSADSRGYTFGWRRRECGTAYTNGWIPVDGFTSVTFHLAVTQMVVTGGIDYRVECEERGAAAAASAAHMIDTGNISVAGIPTGVRRIVVSDAWDRCRVGLKIGTADDGDDTGANAEKINLYFLGRR